MMSSSSNGASQKAAGSSSKGPSKGSKAAARRHESGPPLPIGGLSRQAAALKAARALGSTDAFAIGKLTQDFDSMGQKPPGDGVSSKKGVISGAPRAEEISPTSPSGASPNPYTEAALLELEGKAGGLEVNEGGDIGQNPISGGESTESGPKGVEGSKKGNLKTLTPEERASRKAQLAERAKIRAQEAKQKKWTEYVELTKVLEPSDADFPTLLASMKFMGQPLTVDFMVSKSGDGQLPVELVWHPPYAATNLPSEDERNRLVFWHF